ncbi:uncharacterized protein [Amphiura filiformis]|uniref:uncharacterized protein n=1 Tax=Amphiura filiformis TaxID=82378 RepID=UPI003B21C461
MKKHLVVMVLGIFIMCFNSAISETVDCIALCNQCVEVSDTLTHMSCTKHCAELTQKAVGKITCSKLTAPNKGNPSLEDEIKAIHARISELVESGDYSTIVEEFYVDDCVSVIKGQSPRFGKEELTQAWFDVFESNPRVNLELYTTTGLGENNGIVWEDGISHDYQDDILVGSFRFMNLYKRVNGTLLIFIEVLF